MPSENKGHSTRREMLALLSIGIGGIAGCSSNGDGGNSNGNGSNDDSGTFRVALNSEPSTLDVHETTRYPEQIVLGAIHEPLFYLNKDVEPVPHLVSEFEQNEDATEFVFQLEEGVTFHDGSEFDADVAVWNIERIQELDVYAEKFAPVSSLEATGDYEVTIQTDGPYPLLITELVEPWMGMVSRETAEEAGDGYGRDVIVGSGPYEFAEWNAAENIRLERYDDYDWGPDFATQQQGNADEVVVEIIPESSTLANELMTGDIHGSHDLGLAQTSGVEEHEATDVKRNQGTWTFLPLNTQKSPTDDINVRRAIAHAVNREPLINVGLNGEGELLYGFVPPFWGNALSEDENKDLAPAYDPDSAREELEAAGWTNGSEGEIRTKDGEELVLQHYSFPLGLLENQAEAIQAMLSEVGIGTELNVPEASTFYNELENNEHHLANSGGSYTPHAWAVLNDYYHSSEAIIEGGQNYANYANDEVDELIEASQTEANPDARADAAMEAQQRLHEDVPVVNLNLLNRNYGHKTSLDGIDNFVDHPLWYSQYHLHWREINV